jgi:hypothetical protein
MTGFAVQRRKITTYGKSSRQSSSYTLMRDDSPPARSKSVGTAWQDEPKRASVEHAPLPTSVRVAPTNIVRPSPKKTKDTSWDVPSSDEELVSRRPLPAVRPPKSLQPVKSTQDYTRKKDTVHGSNLPRQALLGTEQKRNREVADKADAAGRLKEQLSPGLAPPAQFLAKRPAKSIETSLPARKRQRTPAKVSPPPASVSQRTRSRTTTPEPGRAYGAVARKIQRAAESSKVSKRRMKTGSSAPAALFYMVREPPSPPTDSSESTTVPSTPNLNSMMDVDHPPKTPPLPITASPATTVRNGSVTPRQKQLWGKLLDSDLESSDGTSSLPSISRLQLSSKSARKVPTLNRSATDVTQSAHSRRVRLIDSLKASAPIVEEDEEMDEADDLDVEENERESSQSKSKQPEVTSKSTLKVTYAQQRSYLEPKTEEAAFDQLVEELSQSNETYSEPQIAEEEEEGSQQAVFRGFHDLRAAGSNLRLYDMFDNLVNDIEGAANTLSIRRSALMELATKLMDPTALAFFLDRGFDRRFIKALHDVSDITSNFIVTAAVALMAEGGASSTVLQNISRSKWQNNAVGVFDVDMDIAKVIRERRNNLSRIAQASVLDFRDALTKSKLWTGVPPQNLSPRLMALKCLELTVRKIRGHGSQEDLLDEATIGRLLTIAESEVGLAKSDAIVLELVLSILESSTTTPAAQKKPAGWPGKLVKAFSQMLPALISLPCGDLALRLTLNLTNEDARACEVFGYPTIVQPLLQSINEHFHHLTNILNPEEKTMAQDRLTLCLGAMINLAEFSDKVRFSAIEGNGDLLNAAVQLFIAGRDRTGEADSIEAMATNVPYGYLAILLGNLCQNDRVRTRVESKLPGGNLALLVNAVDEFTKIHQIADRDMFDSDEGREVYSTFTARLQIVADKLRHVAKG